MCPPNYNIDLGLVCLKTGITNYTPDSDFCSNISDLPTSTDTTSLLYGLMQTCNPELLKNIKLNQGDTKFGLQTLKKPTVNGFDEDGNSISIAAQNFTNVPDISHNTIQHFENYELPTNNYKNNSVNEPTFDIKNIQRYNPMNPIRKDSRRYAIDSRPETKPMVQNNREVKHFYPFEN